jgi:hypothetical protein
MTERKICPFIREFIGLTNVQTWQHIDCKKEECAIYNKKFCQCAILALSEDMAYINEKLGAKKKK